MDFLLYDNASFLRSFAANSLFDIRRIASIIDTIEIYAASMSEASHIARFFDCAGDYRDFSIEILRK